MDFEQSKDINQQSNATKNKTTLLIMAAVFVAPVMLAYMAYFGGWFKGGGKSHGEIIASPWHIDDLPILQFSFDSWQDSRYMGKWNWLLVIDDKVCDGKCQINWFLLQQTKLGLAKYSTKANYLLVLNQDKEPLQGEWENIDYAIASIENGFLNINKQRIQGLNSKPLAANHIYLMDPLGNIFMRYPMINQKNEAPLKSRELRQDAQRVLKYLDVSKKNDE